MSGGVFSETLQSITATKLTELSKKRNQFETNKAALFIDLSNELDQRKKVQLLLDAVKQSFAVKESVIKKRTRDNGTKLSPIELLIKNLEKFLAQADYDPSISASTLESWERSLMQHMDVQSSKYQYASLYGEIVTEWLSAEKNQRAADAANDSAETEDEFQKIKKESVARTEERANWEKLVFEPFETDQQAIAKYLAGLFGKDGKDENVAKALDQLRKQVEEFGDKLSAPGQFNHTVLRWTINGLISSGLLSDEKQAALKDFLSNPVILTEVADVLNMRLASIDTWEWTGDLAVEQRRHLNGTYHVFIDEDLLEALFLQYIGVKWSVFFKKTFRDFSNFHNAWSPLCKPIPLHDQTRRRYFLQGSDYYHQMVQDKRTYLYKSIYFMSQLPNSEQDDQADEDGVEEAVFRAQNHPVQSMPNPASYLKSMPTGSQMQQDQASTTRIGLKATKRFRGMARRSAEITQREGEEDSEDGFAVNFTDDDDEDDYKLPRTPMEMKQLLLHMLSTEIIINDELTCARSEFKSFNSSMPHSTIFTVLSFFGLSEKWLRFFRKFLEAPLKFVDDDISSEARIRRRGIPGAHALSAVCGEAVLFCLDYTVNQSTDGAQLYRMHDEFWLWSPQHETVVKGWESIINFSEVMGVTLNQDKMGCVRIASGSQVNLAMDPALPTGEIRWGFLRLDPKTGHFTIDQSMVDKHVSELQSQLLDKKSIFSWIQAWNTYAGRFFTSNFGKPSNCFGRAHVDAMLSSFQHIQNLIFTNTNVVSYLKDALKERFRIDNVPDGYLYFPTSLGGLELHNPFIGLLQLRNHVCEHPDKMMDKFYEEERQEYKNAKIRFESTLPQQRLEMAKQLHLTIAESSQLVDFMSFEEFIRYKEQTSTSLLKIYTDLLKQPGKESAHWDDWDVIVAKAIEGGTTQAFEGMDMGYWKWVVKLYGQEMRERFGGLAVVDKGLLPTGMVGLFRSGKVKWQG